MQCQFMAKLFAKVVVVHAHNHLKYKGSVPVSKYQHASFIFQVIMRMHNHDLCK